MFLNRVSQVRFLPGAPLSHLGAAPADPDPAWPIADMHSDEPAPPGRAVDQQFVTWKQPREYKLAISDDPHLARFPFSATDWKRIHGDRARRWTKHGGHPPSFTAPSHPQH